MWKIVEASNLIGITTLEQVRKSMAMEDVPDVSVSVLFYFQSWFIVVEVCDFFASTTFCREVCACVCVSLFDWTQPTCMRCVVNRVRVPVRENWNPPAGSFNSFLSIPLKSILKTTTISLDGVCEGQLRCIGKNSHVWSSPDMPECIFDGLECFFC